MYQWRTGNDTISRERFGLEHSFALDILLADDVKWSLNYQIAKTDQSTAEFYFPITRQVLRTRETLYEEKQWVFDAQLDKARSEEHTSELQALIRTSYAVFCLQKKNRRGQQSAHI